MMQYDTVSSWEQWKIFRWVSWDIADILHSQALQSPFTFGNNIRNKCHKKKTINTQSNKCEFIFVSPLGLFLNDLKVVLFFFWGALLLFFCWDRCWIEAVFRIFDISCFFSCILSRDYSVFVSSVVVFCCGLQWFLFLVCVMVWCVTVNTVENV